MRKLFGTDGIRGRANSYPITVDVALQVGKAVGRYFASNSNGIARVIVGKDTRLSGYMLETALTSGLLSMGVDVLAVGPMPTPAVAHLTRSMGCVCGIMITASHNPACDNGIKIFSSEGFKLPDEVEAEIESMILDESLIFTKSFDNSRIGKAYRLDDARGRYIEFAKSSIKNMSLKGLKMVLDCANGAAYSIAPLIFRELGAEVIEFAVSPNGLNINENCGATHVEELARLVKENSADVGIALDGDADRVIFCDENGEIVNGDRIIGMIALDYAERGKLVNNSIVVTSMSNLGLHRAMQEKNIKVEVTDVGDRYVIERMKTGASNIGGEQSGHIIFMDYATTGDGIISALHVLKLMNRKGRKLSQLAEFMTVFPQEICSLAVKKKVPIHELKLLPSEIKRCEEALGNSGRVIVRYSGTENKIRLLVEAEKASDVEFWISELSNAVTKELG
ncbi:MAG: phosphoglucosamine mutase [Lentisphaeria bacterium]|nr:phosphoglucosamine mutase [Lentisphaeria bacterium]